jgi:hypothetical protein
MSLICQAYAVYTCFSLQIISLSIDASFNLNSTHIKFSFLIARHSPRRVTIIKINKKVNVTATDALKVGVLRVSQYIFYPFMLIRIRTKFLKFSKNHLLSIVTMY